MIQAKCLKKYRDKNNRIIGYLLQDINGNTREYIDETDASLVGRYIQCVNGGIPALKQQIRDGFLNVVNLTLTSDNRLVDASEESFKADMKTIAEQKVAEEAKRKRQEALTGLKNRFEKEAGTGSGTFGKLSKSIAVLNELRFSNEGSLRRISPAVGEMYIYEFEDINGRKVKKVKRDRSGQPVKNPDYIPAVVKEDGIPVGFIIKNVGDQPINYIKRTGYVNGRYTVEQDVIQPEEVTLIRYDDLVTLGVSTDFAFRFLNCVVKRRQGPRPMTDPNDATRDYAIRNINYDIFGEPKKDYNGIQIGTTIQTGVRNDETRTWTVHPKFAKLLFDVQDYTEKLGHDAPLQRFKSYNYSLLRWGFGYDQVSDKLKFYGEPWFRLKNVRTSDIIDLSYQQLREKLAADREFTVNKVIIDANGRLADNKGQVYDSTRCMKDAIDRPEQRCGKDSFILWVEED